jgi:nucleoid DNA-binding protein
MSLTKAKLIKSIAADTGLSQNKASEIFSVLIDTLTSTLASGDSIPIRGFGKFYVIDQKERKIRHPSTGQIILLRPKKTVRFKLFKSLREQINGFEYDIEEFERQNKKIIQQLSDLIENSTDYEEEENLV